MAITMLQFMWGITGGPLDRHCPTLFQIMKWDVNGMYLFYTGQMSINVLSKGRSIFSTEAACFWDQTGRHSYITTTCEWNRTRVNQLRAKM